MSRLCAVEVDDGDGPAGALTDAEVAGFCSLIGSAGTETLTKLLANAVVLFQRNPDAVAEGARGSEPDPGRGRGDAAVLGAVAVPGSGADGRRRAPRRRDAEGVPRAAAHRRREPRRAGVRPARRLRHRSRTRTSRPASATGCTSASAPRWRGWRGGSGIEEFARRFPSYEIDESRVTRVHMSNVHGFSSVPFTTESRFGRRLDRFSPSFNLNREKRHESAWRARSRSSPARRRGSARRPPSGSRAEGATVVGWDSRRPTARRARRARRGRGRRGDRPTSSREHGRLDARGARGRASRAGARCTSVPRRGVGPRRRHQPQGHVPRRQARGRGDARPGAGRRRARRDRQHRERRGPRRHRGRQHLQRGQGRRRDPHQEHGDRLRPARGSALNAICPGFIDTPMLAGRVRHGRA